MILISRVTAEKARIDLDEATIVVFRLNALVATKKTCGNLLCPLIVCTNEDASAFISGVRQLIHIGCLCKDTISLCPDSPISVLRNSY